MPKEDYFKWAESLLDPSKSFEKPEAFSDIKVVELCTLVLGPHVSSVMADMGATVFKLELPGVGDNMRSLSPFARFFRGAALGWLKEARNKYHVTIDVHPEEGKELFRELVKRSDVLVENLRAGTMERWGIGYRQLKEINPRLIYIAMNGFGQWGAYMERPSYDAIAQAETGLAWISGFPDNLPMKSGVWLADFIGALMGAVGVMAALAYRDRTGEGQFIELSQAENALRFMDWTWLWQHYTGKARERHGNRDVSISPSDIFPCQDDLVAIAAATDSQFQGLCDAMGMPTLADDSRFQSHESRLREEHAVALLDIIRGWAAGKPYAEIDKLAQEHGFAAHKVCNGKDHFEDEHLRRRNFTCTVEDPVYGEIVEEGIVPKFSETPARIKWAGRPVGFDNNYVFTHFLGLSKDRIRELEDRRVIGEGTDTLPGRTPPDFWDGKSGRLLA